MLILEVHCLAARVTAEHVDRCASLYFDACQAMSRQHLVQPHVWLMASAEAGMFPSLESLLCLPAQASYTRITLARFTKQPYIIRSATPEDIDQLVLLE